MNRCLLILALAGLLPGAAAAQDRGGEPRAETEAGDVPATGDSAERSHSLQLAAGFPDLDNFGPASGLIAVRGAQRFLTLSPTGGIMVGSQGEVFVFGGLYRDLPWRSFVITPLVTVGGYGRGQGRELGSVLQFRSGLETSWTFENGSRLGFQFGHISNAGLGWRNPGVEYFLVTFGVPF